MKVLGLKSDPSQCKYFPNIIGSCISIKCINAKDRISNLPDEIILHILSFVDVKTAVRTGIISKRFAYLWTETSHLDFEESTMEFIYTTICFHKRLNLEKVSAIICRNGERDREDKIEFDRFIRLLSLAGVKEFSLGFEDGDDFKGDCYTLAQHFYSNPYIKKLSLEYCNIHTNGFVNWKSLQSLCLELMEVSNGTMNDILSGCLSLEFLELSFIWGCTRIDLSSNKSLRKLVIDDYDEDDGALEISAPHLQSLVLEGGAKWLKCKVIKAKSLTDCVLDFYEDNEEDNDEPNKEKAITMLISLLEDLSHVEVVTIGQWVVQVLSLIELSKMPCPMSNAIKCLQIDTALTEDDLIGISSLLRNLNRLETLSIEAYDYDQVYSLPRLFGKDEAYEKKIPDDVQAKVDFKLKTVEVSYRAHLTWEQIDKEILSLLEVLLKNAKFMESTNVSGSVFYENLSTTSLPLPGLHASTFIAVIRIKC